MKEFWITIILVLSAADLCAASRYQLYCPRDLLSESRQVLMEQIGVVEKRHNRGPVLKYLKSVGLSAGQPYCAAGQYYCFYIAGKRLCMSRDSIPIPRSGSANKIYDYARHRGLKSKFSPQIDDLLVWKRRKSYSGHIERIIACGRGGWVTTVGFNTSPGRGNQREGEGVYKRRRNIFHPIGRLLVRGLVGFSTGKADG